MVFDPNRQRPGDGDDLTANEQFFDAMIRHQIFLMRMSGSIRNKVFDILNATEDDIKEQIMRVDVSAGVTPQNLKRIESLQKKIALIRTPAWEAVGNVWFEEMLALSVAEPAFVAAALETVSPVIVDTTLPAPQLLRAIVENHPFEGKTMKEWSKSIAQTDLNRIEQQIKIGMVQGESNQVIAQRVVGTVRNRGVDGVTQITRQNAEAITRTATNSIANASRRQMFIENEDLFTEEQYVATLDARTCWTPESLVTMADGSLKPIGDIQIGDMVLGGVSGEPCKVSGIYKDIVSSTVAVYNDDVFIGESTHGHRLLTKYGWKEIADLCLHSDIQKSEVLCRSYAKPSEKVERTYKFINKRQKVRIIKRHKKAWNSRNGNYSQSGKLRRGVQVGNVGDKKQGFNMPQRIQHDEGRGRRSGSPQENKIVGRQEVSRIIQEKQHCRRAFRKCEKKQIIMDRRINGINESQEVNRRSQSEECRSNEKSKCGHDHTTTFRDVKESLGRSSQSRKNKESSKSWGSEDDRGSKSSQKQKSFRGHEKEMARSRVPQETCGGSSKAGGQREIETEWGQGGGCNHAGGFGEQENRLEEIGNREMVTQKTIRGRHRNRKKEIVSLSIEGDHSYVVGGLIVHNTPICRSLDGELFPVGEGPLPPLHFSCRSLRIAVIDGVELAKRPAKPSTQRMMLREFADEQKIKIVNTRDRLPFGTKGKFDTFARSRINELTGTVPGKVSYQEWLTRQSAAFQDDVLGKAKGKLFRNGDLTLKKFVNRQGDELTLNELAKKHKDAFVAAGLDPQDFLN